MSRGWIIALLALTGCGAQNSAYLPLSKGNKWSYEVKTDFDARVDDLSVVGTVPVGDAEGFELRGPSGVTRLAWSGDRLVASQISGQFYWPPIPLLASSGSRWEGQTQVNGKSVSAQAILSSRPVKDRWAGREVDALRTELSLSGTGKAVTLTTWFVKGMGILRQEQRTGDRRDRRIEYLSGP